MFGSSGGTSTYTADKLPPFVTEERDLRPFFDSKEISFSKGYVGYYLKKAEGLSHETYKIKRKGKEFTGYTPYEGKTYAQQNQNEIDGIAALARRGRDGNANVKKVEQHISDAIDGDYLEGSPNFNIMLSKVSDKVGGTFLDEIKPLLGGSVLLMSDIADENKAITLSETLPQRYINRASARLKAANYAEERNLQDTAVGLGIPAMDEGVFDIETLRIAGVYAREWKQGDLEDKYRIWYEQQVAKIRRLEILGNAIRTMVGTQQTITTPYYRPSKAIGTIGGAIQGGVYGMSAGGLYGALIGAAVGGGLGYAAQS